MPTLMRVIARDETFTILYGASLNDYFQRSKDVSAAPAVAGVAHATLFSPNTEGELCAFEMLPSLSAITVSPEGSTVPQQWIELNGAVRSLLGGAVSTLGITIRIQKRNNRPTVTRLTIGSVEVATDENAKSAFAFEELPAKLEALAAVYTVPKPADGTGIVGLLELPLKDEVRVRFESTEPGGTRQLLLARTAASPMGDHRIGSHFFSRFFAEISAGAAVVQRPTVGWHAQRERGAAAPGVVPWVVEVRNISTTSVFHAWNANVATPYIDALRTVKGGQALSLVPRWSEPADSDALWLASVRVADVRPDDGADVAPGQVIDLDLSHASDRAARPRFMLGRRAMRSTRDVVADAVCTGFITHEDRPLGITCRLRAAGPELDIDTVDTSAPSGAEPPGTWELHWNVLATSTTPARATARVGALDLQFSKTQATDLDTDEAGRLTVHFRPATIGGADLWIPEVAVSWHLDLASATPWAQDDLPGEEFLPEDIGATDPATDGFSRETPLVIPLPTATDAPAAAPFRPAEEVPTYRLDVSEGARQSWSQTIELVLRSHPRSAAAPPEQRLLVIDRHPFLVARVDLPGLARVEHRAVSDEVGNWSNRAVGGGAWEIEGGARQFTLVMPPQGVGEAVERTAGTGRDMDALDDATPADYRFSPPARFTLVPSYFEQRFADAPWNLRRVLGFPGQRAPGAGVRELRFELLYGLGCVVTAPGLRLAEIGARLGQPPGRLPASVGETSTGDGRAKTYADYAAWWAGVFRRHQSRLAVLEPYSEAQPSGLVLTHPDVSYEARTSARTRHPLFDDTAPPPNAPAVRAEDGGLAGGLAWLFDEVNAPFYPLLWARPRSEEARLTRPFFSALGGWGNQKAVFADGKVTIYANVAQGRTHYLSIETLGRIGVFWHPAKRVVVYERTVQRAPEFAGDQDALRGRPALRKVREYIEILQPARRYPEFGAAPATRGFVVGCEFKTRIIPVNATWSTALPNDGTRLPLWRADADPAAYPRPHVVLELAADPESGAWTERAELLRPEKLAFYTPPTDASANSDEWPPAFGIDYGLLDALDEAQWDHDRMGAAAGLRTAIPLGAPAEMSEFTFELGPTARPVNVVAERAANVVGVAVRTVTMSRQPRQALAKSLPQASPARAVLTAAERMVSAYEAAAAWTTQAARAARDGDATMAAAAREADVAARLKQAEAELGGASQSLQTDVKEWVARQWPRGELPAKDTVTRFREEFADLRHDLASAAEAALADLGDKWPAEPAKWQALRERVLEPLAASRLLRPYADALAALRRVQPAAVHAPARRVETAVQAIMDTVAQTDDMVGAARADLARAVARAEEDLVGALDDLDAVYAPLDALLPDGWVVKVRRAVASQAQIVERLLSEVVAELGKAAIDPVALDQQLTLLREEVIALPRVALGAAADAQRSIQGARRDVEGWLVERMPGMFEPLRGILSATASAETPGAAAATIVTAAIAQPADALKQALDAAANEVVGKATEVADALAKQVGEAITDARTDLEAIRKQQEERLRRMANLAATAGAAGIKAARDLERHAATLAARARRELDPYVRRARTLVALPQGAVQQAGADVDRALRLLRAFGDPPRVEGLDFDLPRVAYRFDEQLAQAVDMTPVRALLNRGAEASRRLEAFGLEMPTRQLRDRLVPDFPRVGVSLKDVFPDFAGLKLSDLFPAVRLPDGFGDRVKVSHGVDPQTRRAWVELDVDVPLQEAATVFAIGPVTLQVASARLRAHSRLEASAGQSPTRTQCGSIAGNWDLYVGGMLLVRFRDTALTYDESGRLRFTLSPDRVELQAALQFLSNLMAKLGYSESGFSVSPIPLPSVGVRSVLDLPLPDLQFGAFGVSGLHLGSALEVRLDFDGGRPRFVLATSLAVGRKTAPFAVTIFVLGGGGWVEAGATYSPGGGRGIQTRVSVGITAGASLAIALGPIRGGVYVYFGIFVEYETGAGGLTIGVMLLVRGEVSLLGIVSVSLSLRLEATYQSDGTIVGRGHFSAKIKICWCFTLKVSTGVEYRLAGRGRKSLPGPLAAHDREAFVAAAADYIYLLA